MPSDHLSQKLPSLALIVDRQPLIVIPDLPLVEVISLMSQAKEQICLLPGVDRVNGTAYASGLQISVAARHSAVLVTADDRLVGIFTERDLVKLTASHTDLHEVTVGEVMTTNPRTLELSDQHTVMTALGIFQQHQIRHLPILGTHQQIVGIVTPDHIRQVLQPINLLKFKLVSEGMTTDVIQATPGTTVLEIAEMMIDRHIGSIVIVDEQEPLRPVGIITERDIVQFQAFGLSLDQLLAQAVMSSPLFCLQSTDTLWMAQQIMQTKNIRRLVITNERGELAGILTQSNLLQLLDPLEMLYMVEQLQSQLIDRAAELEQTNRELQAEATIRAQVEAELRRASQTLAERVTVRTAQVASLTEELHVQVSEQQSCNFALEASQQGISDFIENAAIGMNWIDPEGNIVWVNQAELNLFGYDRSQYLGQPLINFHVDRVKIADLLERVSHSEPVKNCEAQVWCKDGSLREISIDAHAFFRDDKFIHARLFTRDITDQKKAEASVKQNELKFRAIFDNTFQFVGLLDIDGILLEANRTALDAIGVTSAQVVGQPFWKTLWWTHSPDLQVQLQQAIVKAATGTLVRFEAKHFLADGSHIIVDFSLSPIKDETGKVVMLIPEGRDISDRKRMEAALKESESRFRALLTTAPVGIFQTDRSGNCLFVNEEWMQLTGLSMTTAAGEGWTGALHPDDQLAVFAAWDSAVRSQQEFALEYRFMTPQGQINWVYGNAISIQDETGNITGYLGTVSNITERKRLEQERERFLAIGSDLQVIADDRGYFRWVSPTFESILGWTTAEMTSCPWIEFVHPDDINSSISEKTSIFDGKETIGFENRFRHKDGSYRWFSWNAQGDSQQQVIYAVAVDITAKKSLEQQFLRAQRLESLGSLASGIAHDLNNVLTPILGAAQLLPLTLPSLDDRNQRLLNMLVESSKRGSALVKQILTFARGIDGERTVLQVRHILAEIISVARQTFPKSIEINLNFESEDLWLVNVDATQIHQVLMNLYVNARDAMPNGGILTASAKNIVIDAVNPQLLLQLPAGSYILITITDTGIGMSTEMLEHIFNPFFTTKETGTGLGLSTVLGIIKTHGGSIEVESKVGQGTCFKVYLPAIDSREAEVPTVAENSYDGRGRLILVVDDEVAIRDITKESLEAYNYRVMLANDGIEAIDLYAQNHQSISIILVDMMMPHLDTPSIVLALQEINPKVKIVVMSGSYLNLESVINLQQISAFLNKPFTTAHMLQTLADIQIER